MKPIVRVTAYEGFVIITGPKSNFKDPNWVPADGTRFGCVLMDTENNLGVSVDALKLLKGIRRNCDDGGDVMWWRAGNGKEGFGWIGGAQYGFWPPNAQADRDYRVGAHIVIPNEPPEDVIKAIDESLAGEEEK